MKWKLSRLLLTKWLFDDFPRIICMFWDDNDDDDNDDNDNDEDDTVDGMKRFGSDTKTSKKSREICEVSNFFRNERNSWEN